MNVGELLVKIGANTSDLKRGVASTKKELASLPDEKTIKIKLDDKGGGGLLNSDLTNMRFTVKALIGVLPILASAIGATTGAVGGLVSMMGTATIGTLGLGAAAVSVLNDVFDAQKNIEKAQQDYEKALSTEEQQTALDNLKQAYLGLNQGQLIALASLQKFKNFWKDFADSFQSPIVIGFATALEGLQYLLENIGPSIKAAGAAFVGMFQRMNEAMKGADFQKFFSWLGSSAGSAISTFGDVAINALQGVINLMVAFQPISDAMQGGLRGMAQAFLAWTQSLASSQSFKDFLNFVLTTGPQFLTFIKLFAIGFWDFLVVMAKLGAMILPIINVVLAFFNVLTGLGKSADVARARINDLTNAIKSLFGVQAAASSGQTSSMIDLDKAYQDIIDSIGGVGGELKDAGKEAKKFLASFDEVYQIPDQLDAIGGAIPKIPQTPTPVVTPTTPSGDKPGGTDWIKKLKDELATIPEKISIALNPLPSDMGAAVAASASGAWVAAQTSIADAVSNIRISAATMASGMEASVSSAVTAVQTQWQTMIDRINALPPVTASVALAWATSLASMQTSIDAYSPTINAGFSIVTQAMVNSIPVMTSVAMGWAAMLATMQADISAYNPTLQAGINALIETLKVVIPTTVSVSTAWHTMLDYMQTQLNAYEPFISYGWSMLIQTLSLLVPQSEIVTNTWTGMLDTMQSQINAYEPYISFGIATIGTALTALIQTAIGSATSWQAAWKQIYSISVSFAEPIIELFDGVSRAYQRLMDMMEQPIRIPKIEMPSFQMPKGLTDALTAIQSVDIGAVLKKQALSLGEAAIDMGLTLTGGKAVQIGGAAATKVAESMTQKSLKEAIENILKRRITPDRTRDAAQQVSGFAEGGVIGKDSIVRVGERGRTEAIVPLEGGAMNPFADAVAARMGGTGGSGGGRDVYIGVLDDSQVKQWARQLKLIQITDGQRGLST